MSAKKGVSKISGNPAPKVGEETIYTITDWYSATPQSERNPAAVTWELFKKRSNGSFTTTNIKKTGSGNFTFGEVAQKHTYRLEAYRYDPEGSGSSTIDITPQPTAVPVINKVELRYVDDSPGTTFSYTEKLRANAQCVHLTGEKLTFTLWEDDAAGDGHNANNLVIESKQATVGSNGQATVEFVLSRAMMQKAMQGESDPKQLEFYVTVEYYQNRKHASDNVNVQNPSAANHSAPQNTPANRPSAPSSPQPAANNAPPRAPGSPAASKPESKKEEKGIVDTVTDYLRELWDWAESKGTIKPEQKPANQPAGGKTVTTVNDSGAEDILDAYFAKKEYTKQTGEADGTHEYTFGGRKSGNQTGTAAQKETVANTILGKVQDVLKNNKKYTTKEAIIQSLTANEYGKDTADHKKVTFQTFKLGPEFKKVNSAPLEAKLYLVARTSGLNGKQATLIIKEKDGLIKGSAGAVLPILEITEAQMEQTSTSGEVPGTEKSQFIAIIENGLAKVPVHLRPKSDDDLKKWKEKLSKGKEDGEYTYKFGGANNITDENSKKTVAETILRNAKAGNAANPKIADGKTAYIDDIIKALEIKNYQKDETVKFKLYKKEKELLFIQAKAQGEKQHDKEFLKSEGAYFIIGKNCFCNRDITLTEFESILRKLRESEGVANKTGVFYADNCPLTDKTNASFLAKLNEKFKEFEINTCIRKIHFLTQVYHETDKFQTTLEYANGVKYDPGHHDDAVNNGNTVAGDGEKYKGKGLMQLTWKNNYSKYKGYSGEDVVASPLRVAQELDLAVDSAGWFWTQGKVLSAGSTWTVPNTSYSQHDNSTGKQFPKTQITNGTVSYATINMNLLADKDYIDTISWLVNGGGNGRQERRDYLKEIKKIFNYPADCANAGGASGGNSSVTIHFVGDTAVESGISQRTRTILEEVGAASKNNDIYITSTARTPAEQARIMYGNIARTGAAEQKGIYANAGDQVIDVYTAGQNAHKTQAQIIQEMEAKINELGPSSVSKHLADPTVMNTFDVSIQRLTNPNDFKTEMQRRTELHKLLDENGAYHIEINQ